MGRRRRNISVALTAGRLAARGLIRRGTSARDLALGEALTSQLDNMKGLAMKIGQIVSYMDVPLPEEVQAQLAKLQTGAQGRPLEELRAVVTATLGGELESLFEEVDPDPVAAASIGQVHRARFGGREVAVKIQYPEIEATFSADLGTLHRIAALASLASVVDGQAIVQELADRLTEECDYEREARAQAKFAEAFAEDSEVWVPEVVWERSGAQVLTTRWAEALGFRAFCEQASMEQRCRAAATLTRFAYRSLLVLGTIQADPHPGNFAFTDDGRVVFFDFGCARELDDTMVTALRCMSEAVLAEDFGAFREATLALGVVGVPAKFDYNHYYEMTRHLYRPFIEPNFVFEPSFIRAAMDYNSPSSPNARTLAMPPAYIWVARLQWGLWSVLTRLRAEGDFLSILREQLASEQLSLPLDAAPLSTATRTGATGSEA